MSITGALTPPEWTLEALCAQVDPDLFFPDKGGSTSQAKAICASCPVREACLEYGLDDPNGLYGGLSERERWKLRKQRGVKARRHRSNAACGTEAAQMRHRRAGETCAECHVGARAAA